VEALAAEMDAELVPMGSAGVKVMSVVRDVSDAYVHAGGQYGWDNAAPVAVARAAGLFCSRVDGSELRYNQDDVSLPDLVVCRPELSAQILEFVRRHGTD
jgi:3'(2'), 5'-bisphosphate nucleotidase